MCMKIYAACLEMIYWLLSRTTTCYERKLLKRRSAKLLEQRNIRINRIRFYWHDIKTLIKHLHEICSLYIFSSRYLSFNKTIFEGITSFCFVRFDDVLVSHFSATVSASVSPDYQCAEFACHLYSTSTPKALRQLAAWRPSLTLTFSSFTPWPMEIGEGSPELVSMALTMACLQTS